METQAAQVKAEDFGIIAELHEVLAERDVMLDSNQIRFDAEAALTPVQNGVRPLGPGDPLTYANSALDGISTIPTTPETVTHPDPIRLLIGDENPASVDTVWDTILNLPTYTIWSRYQARGSSIVEESFDEADWGSTFFSLFSQTPFTHPVDVDGDGDDDILVGITISFSLVQGDGWGVEGSQLWVEPTIEYRVDVIDISDVMWNVMDNLQVSLLKPFAYGVTGAGESYAWEIDSYFTIPPTDWALQVGFERFWFDISGLSGTLIGSILDFFNPLTGTPDEPSDVAIAALAAPYSIQIDNAGQTDCPSHYDLANHGAESLEHDCRISAGFGYGHFEPRENDNHIPDMWEISYLEVAMHPVEGSFELSSTLDLTIRDDSVMPGNSGLAGEDGLMTIEYYADERMDLWLHFHEDRSNYSEETGGFCDPDENACGNVTETLAWLRGMPEGSMSAAEIDRCFDILGSSSAAEFPGQKPTQLSLIIGIKNFTRDSSQNVDDPSLPVNPGAPDRPNTLLLIRSTQSVSAIDYVSWFEREGADTDHRMTRIDAEDLPTGILLYGDFWVGGSDEIELDTEDVNLDILTTVLDVTILAVVDIFIDIANVINSIPTALVEVISGSTGSATQGTAIHLEMYDDYSVDREVMSVGSISLSMGSTDVPVATGTHVLLGDDKQQTHILDRREDSVPKLVPISVSLHHEGLNALHVVDDNLTQSQQVSLGATGGQPLRVLFLEHQGANVSSSEFQSIYISEHPSSLDIDVSLTDLTFVADRDIPEVIYIGKEGNQRQALVIDFLPGNFTMAVDNDVTWVSQTPIGSVSLMISNASNPQTMDGDHFLFIQDQNAGEATLSTRIHGITEMGYRGAENPGAPGVDGRGEGFLKGPGDAPFHAVILDQTNYESPADGLTAHILLDPLPADLALQIPQGGENETSPLDVPEFQTDEGLAGIAFFLAGFTDFGESVNSMLGELVKSVTGGAVDDVREDFSFGIELDAGDSFDLVVDAQQGRMNLAEPEWLHGISMEAGTSVDNRTGFRCRTWLPDLSPNIDLSVSYENKTNETGMDQWDIEIDLEGWKPANPEFMIEVNGYNGRDLHLMLLGFEPGQETDIEIETQIMTDYRPVVPQLSVFSNYEMSTELDAVHAALLDRSQSTRYELLLQDIPKAINMAASIGSMVSVGMEGNSSSNPELSLSSLMLQSKRFSDGKWWPATVFLHELPRLMNLSTAPSDVFDITKPLGFQGMSTLVFSSSGPGMDMYISSAGRAVDARGDSVLLADNLASHMSIEPTEDFGMRIRSSGDGIGRLYVRQSNVPAQPGMWLHQMEAAGENLKSATIQTHMIGGYPVIEISDVRGGRIITNSRADVEFAGMTFDGRAVLIDAQVTGGVPTGTTIGVNGLASDLSLLNLMGFEADTTHYLMPEPLTTALATGVATMFG
ncbi:MAG: hypothetical protein VX320_00245 [Candidatus Thermoplasmatota archaeon]|nr:hypothetical protein [Candidatus Thermoplasmatota archaeon]